MMRMKISLVVFYCHHSLYYRSINYSNRILSYSAIMNYLIMSFFPIFIFI